RRFERVQLIDGVAASVELLAGLDALELGARTLEIGLGGVQILFGGYAVRGQVAEPFNVLLRHRIVSRCTARLGLGLAKIRRSDAGQGLADGNVVPDMQADLLHTARKGREHAYRALLVPNDPARERMRDRFGALYGLTGEGHQLWTGLGENDAAALYRRSLLGRIVHLLAAARK